MEWIQKGFLERVSMRFSFEGNRSSKMAGINPREKTGLPKTRRCLGCNREMDDDGSVLFIRGFCSHKCLDNYLKSGIASERNGDGAYL